MQCAVRKNAEIVPLQNTPHYRSRWWNTASRKVTVIAAWVIHSSSACRSRWTWIGISGLSEVEHTQGAVSGCDFQGRVRAQVVAEIIVAQLVCSSLWSAMCVISPQSVESNCAWDNHVSLRWSQVLGPHQAQSSMCRDSRGSECRASKLQ